MARTKKSSSALQGNRIANEHWARQRKARSSSAANHVDISFTDDISQKPANLGACGRWRQPGKFLQALDGVANPRECAALTHVILKTFEARRYLAPADAAGVFNGPRELSSFH